MAYIYIITNKINNKSYIGKTENINPLKRWEEHCKDYKRDYYKNRPLYKSMNKYGLDNFEFKILLKTNIPEKDEIKLIKKYDTYKNGYNATLGGDGKKLISKTKEKEIIKYYLENPNTSYNELKNIFNHDRKTIKNIFNKYDIKYIYKNTHKSISKKIMQYDLKGNSIMSFNSAAEAARHLNNKATNTHIVNCCNGKRKTAYGFIWKWL